MRLWLQNVVVAATVGSGAAGRWRRALEHTWPSSLSGSAAESEAMHAMARLRAAARAEPSSLKSAVRQASDSSSLRWPPKRLSRSLRMSMLSSFTSSVSLATPEGCEEAGVSVRREPTGRLRSKQAVPTEWLSLRPGLGGKRGGLMARCRPTRAGAVFTSASKPETSLGASCRTAVTAMTCGISSTTVFRPIEQMSRCSSLPVSTCIAQRSAWVHIPKCNGQRSCGPRLRDQRHHDFLHLLLVHLAHERRKAAQRQAGRRSASQTTPSLSQRL